MPTVKLNNGTEISLSEFNEWNARKQHLMTMPAHEKKALYVKMGQPKRRAVNTPKGQFNSMREAEKSLNISRLTLVRRLNNQAYPDYNFVDKNHIKPEKLFHKVVKRLKKKTVTPIGVFKSKNDAIRAIGIELHNLRTLLKNHPKKYYLVSKQEENNSQKFKLTKKIMTPLGMFNSKSHAALAYYLPKEQFDVLMEFDPDNFYYIEEPS